METKYGLMKYEYFPKYTVGDYIQSSIAKFTKYTSPIMKYNVGDYIQSLAAKQYLPKVDILVDREKLNEYDGSNIKMIMNGWYMHNPDRWPVSDKIVPLFISMHINSGAQEKMLSTEGVEYLRKYEPIGCRDIYTLELLQNKAINAYHSGCLTTTLDLKYKKKDHIERDKIYIVDPFFKLSNLSLRKITKSISQFQLKENLLKSVLSEELLLGAEYVTHEYSTSDSEDVRFRRAEELLEKYSTAKLVITSRIHCALPCLALGTPVIFLNYGFNSVTELCRVNGIMDLFNTINLDQDANIDANFELPINKKIGADFLISNPTRYLKYTDELRRKCESFIDNNF